MKKRAYTVINYLINIGIYVIMDRKHVFEL